jgi:uncharacterized protein
MKHHRLNRLCGTLLCTALCTALLCAAALPAFAAEVPTPDKSACVVDTANILSDDTETYVTNISIALQDSCGAQIGVYTVQNIGNMELEEYAYQLFNNWGLGDKDKKNGVLLLLTPGDNNAWMVQGEGLETTLPTSTLSNILQKDMASDFDSGNYDSGTCKTVKAVAQELCTIYNVSLNLDQVASGSGSAAQQEGQPGTAGPGMLGAVFIVVLVAILFVVLIPVGFHRRRRRFYGYGGYPPPPPQHRRHSGFYSPMPFDMGPRPPRDRDEPNHHDDGFYGGNPAGGSHSSMGGGMHSSGLSHGGGSFHSGGGSSRGGGAGLH